MFDVFKKNLKSRFLKKNCGIATIEYAIGLVAVAVVLIVGFTDTGTVVIEYLQCISTGDGSKIDPVTGDPVPCIQH
jgi:Flp pilus assembly pilin Flp